MMWDVAGGILIAWLIIALLPWLVLGAIAAWRLIAAFAIIGLAFLLLVAAPNIFIGALAAFLAFWLIFPTRRNRISS